MDNQNSPAQQKFWTLLSKKLANEATEIELQELKSILLSHPNLHHQADLITEMWEQRSQGSNFANEAAYVRHVMKHKGEFFIDESNEVEETIIVSEEEGNKPSMLRMIFSKRLTIISFVSLVIVATGLIYFLSLKKNVVATAQREISYVITENGNRTMMVLPDGSQVWLNAGSNLEYNNSTFNKELREVSLNGEAYFDVARNESKPFIIHTKKMDIRVIGTAFNVRSYNNEKTAEASLIRGTIEVTLKDRNQKIVLRPNDKISIPTEEEKPVASKTDDKTPLKTNSAVVPPIIIDKLKPNPTSNIIPEIAWTQNQLSIDGKSLEEIGPILEKWFGKTVKIQNESLKKNSYTGTFEKETIEQVLTSFQLTNRLKPFKFRIENETVIIY